MSILARHVVHGLLDSALEAVGIVTLDHEVFMAQLERHVAIVVVSAVEYLHDGTPMGPHPELIRQRRAVRADEHRGAREQKHLVGVQVQHAQLDRL